RSAVVRHRSGQPSESNAAADESLVQTEKLETPGFNWILHSALYIMQDRISRSRLAGDPPDLLLTPRVSHVPWMEFTGGRATIEEGYGAVQRSRVALETMLDPARLE